MSSNQGNSQDPWEQRRIQLGNTRRAVLFKNLPNWINDRIHDRHVRYVSAALDGHFRRILDIGCGYGRIAGELKHQNPDLLVEGVELNEGFCSTFSDKIGVCYNESIQEFSPVGEYDCICMVTVLMYLDKNVLKSIIKMLWGALPVGGKMVCIEPIEGFITAFRRLIPLNRFKPTGTDVSYFSVPEMRELFSDLPDSSISNEEKIGLFPIIDRPALHAAMVITKVETE